MGRGNRICASLETPVEGGEPRGIRAGGHVQRIGQVHSCFHQIQRFRYRRAVLDADQRQAHDAPQRTENGLSFQLVAETQHPFGLEQNGLATWIAWLRLG